MEPVICETEEQLERLKTKAMKAKLISLDRMKKHPLENPTGFSKREKATLLGHMSEIFGEWSDEAIDKAFNDIVNEALLENGKDVSVYPIYDLSKKTEEVMDIGGNVITPTNLYSTNWKPE